MIKKYSINALTALLLIFSAQTSKPINIPAAIKQLPITISSSINGAKQRALFAKVILRALWNHALNKNQYKIIENKLAKLYESALNDIISTEQLEQQVDALCNAIKNNNSTAIEPHEFLLGASSSAYQIEGGLDKTSAAARFYAKLNLPIAQDSIDFYHRYHSDIKQMKDELHINAYRLSIAWNRIEPQNGVYCQEAIEFYRNVIAALLEQDIKPMIVFHHYDVPTWFEDLGGFEYEENGKIFKQFCLYFYQQLAQELGHCLISMCNAPEGPAFKGYFTGDGTPGEKNNLHKTHTVIANMYYELVDTALEIKQTYKKLKKNNPHLLCPLIGTQLNVLPFDPHHTTQATILNRLGAAVKCEIASYIQSGGTYTFLISGEYRMFTPDAEFMQQTKGANVYRYHPNAYRAFDWIGVNIYSNNFLNNSGRINGTDLIEEDEERYTDNPNYRNYPEGIYRAVQMITENIAIPLGKLKNKNGKPLPIIVTENGIATKDDAKRTRYFKRALCTITELITDGYPVIGYLPWTSHDNYEWPTVQSTEGFGGRCYGFFAVNMDKNSPHYLTRTLKEGSRYYADFAQQFLKKA